MDKRIERIYLAEILKQATNAIYSSSQFSLLLHDSQKDFFREVEHFVQHAAAISQLLYSTEKKGRARANHLRNILNIDDNNVLRNRKLRNHLVHFDERLDYWAHKSKRHNFVDQSIGDMHKLIKGVEATDYIRNFNPATMEYIFLKEKFNLRDIQIAIEQIKKTIEQGSITP